MDSRLSFIEAPTAHASQPMCDAVHTGLTSHPKTLPCRFFYDRAGSELFEQITSLPEYYLTRCEAEILSKSSGEIVEAVGKGLSVCEFGSGSSAKTRSLLSAAFDRNSELHYVPIDISREFLRESSETLLGEYPSLSITAIAGEYSDAVSYIPDEEGARLILFLGSNIGNFCHGSAAAFLKQIQVVMRPEDRLLVGVDLVKDRDVLHAAYNDAAGVTGQFNLNLLSRVNRELGGQFVLDNFNHEAPFDEDESRIEMRLVCRDGGCYRVEDLDSEYEFQPGEWIVTEWSHKYTPASFGELAESAGLEVSASWQDSKGWFAEYLLQRS
ncbi:MAG TPA: L-histidine N(alpha)-methyltransferase [Fimbriimonas sp.]|nr:L-histidine N(alpha)-methyltransferase [Fimbriimonas sp.]